MTLKDLDKFLKICRKHGVSEISYEGTSVKLGDAPPEKKDASDDEDVEAEVPSEEDMMFYHVGGR